LLISSPVKSQQLDKKVIHVIQYSTHENPRRSRLMQGLLESDKVSFVWSTHLMQRSSSREGLKLDLGLALGGSFSTTPDYYLVPDARIAEELMRLTDIPVVQIRNDPKERVASIVQKLNELGYTWNTRVFVLYNKFSSEEAHLWTAKLVKKRPTLLYTRTVRDLRYALETVTLKRATLVINLLDHVADTEYNKTVYSEYVKQELARLNVPTLGTHFDYSNNESFIVVRDESSILHELFPENESIIYKLLINIRSLRNLKLQRAYIDIWDKVDVICY